MKRIVISDESINSYGFWVVTDGIDLSPFLKNPVMLWNHNRDDHGTVNAQLPIGIWKDLRIENGVLTGEPVFDETDEFAVRIKQKYEAGKLNACSMGFVPLEWSDAPEMLKQGQKVATVTRCRLMEISICDIPSNANATVVLYDENSKTINLSDLPNMAIGPKINDMSKEIALKLGLEENASPQACVEAIQKKDERIATLEAENKKLKEHEKAANDAKKDEAVRLLDDAVKTGRIDAKARPQFEKLFELDHDAAKAALAEMPERKPLTVQPPKGNAGGDERSSWNYLDWMKKDPEGLRKMKTDDPDRFKTLQQTLKKP
jgi:HK97 family phage prohead protease